MHIMIYGNYLSLDNILTISAIEEDEPRSLSARFFVSYQNNSEFSFYYSPTAPSNGMLRGRCFYFKDKEELFKYFGKIMSILTASAV